MSQQEVKLVINAEVARAEANIRQLQRTGHEVTDRLAQDWQTLGVKSALAIEQERARAIAAYTQIKNSGVASAQDIARAKAALAKRMQEIDAQAHKQTSALDILSSGWGKLAVVIGAVGLAGKKAFDTLAEGAETQQKRQAFENLAASHGQLADSILDGLRRVSAGTVETAELMEKAGTAMLTGIPAERLVGLMEIARASSRITGQSITKSFEDIALGVARQSKMILDNLGIMIDVDKANKTYAATLGKTADALSDAEKKQAFMNAVLEAGGDIVKRVGVDSKTNAESVQSFKTAVADLGTVMKELFVSQPVIDGIEAMTGAVTRLRQALAPTTGEQLEEVGLALQDINEKIDAGNKRGFVFGESLETLLAQREKLLQQYRDLVSAGTRPFAAPKTETPAPKAPGDGEVYDGAGRLTTDKAFDARLKEAAELEKIRAAEEKFRSDMAVLALRRDASEVESEQTLQAALAQRYGALQTAMASETELVQSTYWERQAIVVESLAAGVISQQEADQMKVALTDWRESQMTTIEQRERDKRQAIEQAHQQAVTSMRFSAASQAAGLLNVLSGKSKTAALIALGVEKGHAMAQTFMSGKAAEIRALADLGPVAGAAAAAEIAMWTKINMGLIGATGLAQAALSGGGGGNFGAGTRDSPIVTQPSQQTQPQQIQLVIQVEGDVVDLDEWMEKKGSVAIREAVGRGVDFGVEVRRN